MKVYNLKNANGNTVKNQFVIESDDGLTISFQSYDSSIASFDRVSKVLTVSDKWDYSKTTVKAFLQFLKQNTYIPVKRSSDVRKLIKDGVIKQA